MVEIDKIGSVSIDTRKLGDFKKKEKEKGRGKESA